MFRYLGQRIFNATIEKPVMKRVVENISRSSNSKKLVNTHLQEFNFTTLEDGLRKTIEYYEQNA